MAPRAKGRVVVHVVGVRPNYVKASAVLRAAEALPGVRNLLVDTGQHYDTALRDAFYQDLALRLPDRYLGVGSGSHARQTAAVMVAFEDALRAERPDAVVVYGDVNSTMAAALVAAKLLVPVVHVEAGLRSFDRTMPEEINRVVTDGIAELLLTPSADAEANLLREGAPREKIRFVGNVMIDALQAALPRALESAVLRRVELEPEAYTLLTVHRPHNVDGGQGITRVVDVIDEMQRRTPVLFPVHPRTRASLEQAGLAARLASMPGVRMTGPLGYHDFLCALANARVVLTDSGGVQEETSVLGVPCVTLRDHTERPVTITHGTNQLAGTSPDRILAAFREALGRRRKPAVIEGWDGQAGPRVARAIEAWLSAR
ncbi:UDP-N-acetylglucosamine 2-epimerase (non-hydrolyzing) [Polyangium sp. 15x6]|uniref:non-hydrolyzing UDP-N-acetylglucosamine 2-epimerase n=1 Tax=Polyangium sp. 15x6 TaxID=3042687 RepID=UPI00249BB844|nr:UDP-N-acetylglucosamine 2-epimerase (non-hydrolyzing) [Polyangium sp. 15x6]MDI3289048.1 UDP-N-acetylglucosamine 2-epimerase (non-hydrolyzing) [Polyangium sp. 15x6]